MFQSEFSLTDLPRLWDQEGHDTKESEGTYDDQTDDQDPPVFRIKLFPKGYEWFHGCAPIKDGRLVSDTSLPLRSAT